MKWFMSTVFFLLVGVGIGWQAGTKAAERSFEKGVTSSVKLDMSTAQPLGRAATKAVDCYDSHGKLVIDEGAVGWVTVECAPGQTAKPHQPDWFEQNAPKP